MNELSDLFHHVTALFHIVNLQGRKKWKNGNQMTLHSLTAKDIIYNRWHLQFIINQSVRSLQVLLISAHYVYKAHLITESVSFFPNPWPRSKSCQRMSG